MANHICIWVNGQWLSFKTASMKYQTPIPMPFSTVLIESGQNRESLQMTLFAKWMKLSAYNQSFLFFSFENHIINFNQLKNERSLIYLNRNFLLVGLFRCRSFDK